MGGFGNIVIGDNNKLKGGVSNAVYGSHNKLNGGVRNTVHGSYNVLNGGVINTVFGSYNELNGGIGRTVYSVDTLQSFKSNNSLLYPSKSALFVPWDKDIGGSKLMAHKGICKY